jgi:hypothetical protein
MSLNMLSHIELLCSAESMAYQSVVGLEDFIGGQHLDSILLGNDTTFPIQDGFGSPGKAVAEGSGPYTVSVFIIR